MFGDGEVTFHEFMMLVPLPVATTPDALLNFLRGRADAVLFWAQACNHVMSAHPRTPILPSPRRSAEELRRRGCPRWSAFARSEGASTASTRRANPITTCHIRPTVAESARAKKLAVTPAELAGERRRARRSGGHQPRRSRDLTDLAHVLIQSRGGPGDASGKALIPSWRRGDPCSGNPSRERRTF